MRIVASACLVLAILFMVGCGTSAEDKKLITDQGTKIQTLESNVKALQAIANADLQKKIADIEAFLKDPKSTFGKYGAPPPAVTAPGTPGGAPPTAPKTEPKAQPKTEKKAPATKTK